MVSKLLLLSILPLLSLSKPMTNTQSCPINFSSLVTGCYHIHVTPLSWDDANLLCHRQLNGSSLVVINSREEGEAISQWLEEMSKF